MSSLEQYAEWYGNLRKVSVKNPLNAPVRQQNLITERACNIKSRRTKRKSKSLRDKSRDRVLETDDDDDNEDLGTFSETSSGTGRD